MDQELEVVKLTLTAQVSRYGKIAQRWPKFITVEGTREQVGHFLVHGVYEAGCENLFVGDRDELENECVQAYYAKVDQV